MAADADVPFGNDEGDREPRAPVFFLSYARVGRYGKDAFADLSQDVAELAGRPAGSDPGFMDRSMGGGEEWLRELLREEGVYGFRRLSWEAEYRCVVWRLAQRIAKFYFTYRVEPLVLEPSDLRDIFRERQP